MVVIFFRTVILYLVVLFAIRIMGKSELSKLSPFQMAVLFMLADLASMPIENTELSLLNGTVSILALVFLQVVISLLSLKFEWFKNFINGKPGILIDNGKINEKELRRLRINVNDLTEQLRIKNFPSVSDVAYAVIESNGDLSVIPKPPYGAVKPKDLNIPKPSEEMPLILVCDGTVYKSNLTRLNWSEDFLKKQLSEFKMDSYKEILLAYSDENKKLHIFPKAPDGIMSVEVMV